MERLARRKSETERLTATSTLTRLGSTKKRRALVPLDEKLTPTEKVVGFARSTIESFPELFGIEPSKETQHFRAVAPVSGFASQAVGAFVPYLGAGKLARAAPLTGAFIRGAEGLGRGTIAKAALGQAAEALVVETARVGLAATPLPEALYEGLTGRETDTRGLPTLLGEGAINVAGSAVFGGIAGGIASRLKQGLHVTDTAPKADPTHALVFQIQAMDEAIKRAEVPESKVAPEILSEMRQHRADLMRANSLGVLPEVGDNGRITLGKPKTSLGTGKLYRPLVGEGKNRSTSNFLNRIIRWEGSSPDKQTRARRIHFDRGRVGTFHNLQEFQETLARTGASYDEFATYATDARIVDVRTGQGFRKQPDDFISPDDWIRNKYGEVEPFYHGTRANIEAWDPDATGRGGISFSSNPEFASNWVGARGIPAGERVYVQAVKKGNLADFRNPADVKKAMDITSVSDIPGMEKYYSGGAWAQWENLSMLDEGGWDKAFMVEVPGDKGVMGSRNLFVRKSEDIHDYFSPQAMWARNVRELRNEPKWTRVDRSVDKRAASIQEKFTKGWTGVGDGWFVRQEADTGMYVMSKKLVGTLDAPASGDQWVVFRTAQPGMFAKQSGLTEAYVRASAFHPIPIEYQKTGDTLVDAGAAMIRESADLPDRMVNQSPTLSRLRSLSRDARAMVGNVFGPFESVSSRSPQLRRAWLYLQEIVGNTEERVQKIMQGDLVSDPNKSLLLNTIGATTRGSKGIRQAAAQLTPEDWADVHFAVSFEVPFEEVVAANTRVDVNGRKLISDQAMGFLGVLKEYADFYPQRAQNLQGVFKNQSALELLDTFRARRGHYVISNDFSGPYKVMLNEEDGTIFGMVAGNSPGEARESAAKLVEYFAKRGQKLSQGAFINEAIRDVDQLANLRTRYRAPGFLKARGTLQGFEMQRTPDLDADKAIEMITKNIRQREEYFRNAAIIEHLAEIRGDLHRTRPLDATFLDKKIAMLINHDEGEFARATNRMMDKGLHMMGLSGKDSATSIVQATQRVLGLFQFNFFNIAQPVLNITGILQTLLPELAFNVHASTPLLSKYYVTYGLLDGQGNVRGTMGVFSELKLLYNAMRWLGVKQKDMPDDLQELIQHAIDRRLIAPKFAEEVFGLDGEILSRPLDAFKSMRNFTKFFIAANEVLMAKSEEVARATTITAAYEVAKMRGMNRGQMLHFATELIGKVNFNYSTIDRATIFTTPVGSLAGTFKNWMFHYMANMLRYAEGGPSAWPALAWQTASTAALGGAAATPLLLPIADGFSKYFTNQDAFTTLYGMVGADGDGIDERIADGIMYGIPGALGLSLSSQVASPAADPVRDASMIFSFAAFDRMKALSSATRDALVAYKYGGESPWEDEQVRGQLVRALAPRTVFRAMALTEDRAVRSLSTGYDVTGQLGLGSALLYGAGFNPTELEKTYEVYNKVRTNQREQRKMVQELGQTLAQAWDNDDTVLANRVFTRAMALGIDQSKVLRSAEARRKRKAETQLGYAASAEDEAKYGFMFDED